MVIANDTITFSESDAALLSTDLRTALTQYNGAPTPEAALTNIINAHLETVQVAANARRIDTIKVALIEADPATRLSAQMKLDEVKTILGIETR